MAESQSSVSPCRVPEHLPWSSLLSTLGCGEATALGGFNTALQPGLCSTTHHSPPPDSGETQSCIRDDLPWVLAVGKLVMPSACPPDRSSRATSANRSRVGLALPLPSNTAGHHGCWPVAHQSPVVHPCGSHNQGLVDFKPCQFLSQHQNL